MFRLFYPGRQSRGTTAAEARGRWLISWVSGPARMSESAAWSRSTGGGDRLAGEARVSRGPPRFIVDEQRQVLPRERQPREPPIRRRPALAAGAPRPSRFDRYEPRRPQQERARRAARSGKTRGVRAFSIVFHLVPAAGSTPRSRSTRGTSGEVLGVPHRGQAPGRLRKRGPPARVKPSCEKGRGRRPWPPGGPLARQAR
jgi:hypothetical protein